MKTAAATAWLFDACLESPAQGEIADVVRESERQVRAAVRNLRPFPPPFDSLAPEVADVVVDRWKVPCEAMFEFLAGRHPADLLRLIRASRLHSADLTFAAEIAGRIADSEAVREVLLELLGHPDAVVREGAIYGLAPHLNEVALRRLLQVAATDKSAAVRSAAADASSVT